MIAIMEKKRDQDFIRVERPIMVRGPRELLLLLRERGIKLITLSDRILLVTQTLTIKPDEAFVLIGRCVIPKPDPDKTMEQRRQ